MSRTEFRAARDKLDWSIEKLAQELRVDPEKARAWDEGLKPIPRLAARRVRWLLANAERLAALEASGLPECEWLGEWEQRAEKLAEPADFEPHLKALDLHRANCATCRAREEYVAKRFPPMPPYPLAGGTEQLLVRAFGVFSKLSALLRPAVVGAFGNATNTLIVRPFIGALGGFLLAAMFLLFGLLAALVATMFGVDASFEGAGLVAFGKYILGFTVGGAVMGLLWPLSRYRPGRYLLGVIGVACAMPAIVWIEEESIFAWLQDTWIFIGGATIIFGIAVGYALDKELAA
jgi:hypothetical protein